MPSPRPSRAWPSGPRRPGFRFKTPQNHGWFVREPQAASDWCDDIDGCRAYGCGGQRILCTSFLSVQLVVAVSTLPLLRTHPYTIPAHQSFFRANLVSTSRPLSLPGYHRPCAKAGRPMGWSVFFSFQGEVLCRSAGCLNVRRAGCLHHHFRCTWDFYQCGGVLLWEDIHPPKNWVVLSCGYELPVLVLFCVYVFCCFIGSFCRHLRIPRSRTILLLYSF